MKKANRVLVIGAGASGLMAAYAASSSGASVTVLERNEKAGKKIYITGKGRCNLTNNCDEQEFLKNVVTNPRFLYSAINAFTTSDMMGLMEELGCPVKTERGNRVFPVSDHASDVTAALLRGLKKQGAKVQYSRRVLRVESWDMELCAVDHKNIRESADCIIVCTGGLSYPSTGSDGDGYELARSFGHRVGNLYPSLVRLRTCEDFVSSLQGLSLKNVSVSMTAGKKTVFSGVGEMLFTDDGVSGPLILSCSAHYAALRERYENFVIHTDLKCASTAETLDARILKALEEMKTRSVYNALSSYLPRSLLAVVLKLSGVSADKKARDVTREERRKIIENTKDLKLTVRESGPFEEAVVTHGGINVKDIDPHTMESKIVQGLYFCGEVLDTDAMTGGFNLQTAWSTGYLAGVSAAGKEF